VSSQSPHNDESRTGDGQKAFQAQRNKNYLTTPRISDSIIILDHLKPSYNIGKIFRNAEIFDIRKIHLVGIDFFDPEPGIGIFNWVPTKFHNEFYPCYVSLIEQRYTIFILEPAKGESLTTFDLPKKSTFVFGHEEFGISFEPDLFPDIQLAEHPPTW
jgi:tRNA G18 (ribose-2'-O)-methylase SpoU